jgi:hypothetical protein
VSNRSTKRQNIETVRQVLDSNAAKKEQPSKKRSVEGHLRSIILTSLGGPAGDPDACNLEAAAHAAASLRLLGETVDTDTIATLRGENVYDYDYLKDVGFDDPL